MSKNLNAPQKKRQGVGASCSVLIHYLYLAKLISGMYPNKSKCDALGGIIITQREVVRVTRREQLYIFMKHKDFGYNELHCVQRWVIFTREYIETHVFEDSEEK